MNTVNMILVAISAVSVGLSVFILFRIKHVVYLLEQPVVKKMGPELKLKTVKVDDGEENRRPGHNRPQGQGQSRNAPTPRNADNQGNRERHPRHEGSSPRSDRPERTGNEHRGHDRDRNRERGDRGNRNERNDRMDRGDRGERPERQRPRLEVFTSEGSPTPANDSVRAPEAQPAPAQHQDRPALAPRRPLPASVEREEATAHAGLPETPDAVFAGDESDIQHGRRTQVKKKPRFEINEEELKSEETKV